MSLIKIAAGGIVMVLLAFAAGIFFRRAPTPESDRRKVVAAQRADTVSVQDMMARLEAERAAAIAAAVQARVQSVTVPPARLPIPPAIAAPLKKATEAWRAAHNGENPPPLEADQGALLPYFENTKDAAAFLEWLNAWKASRR